MRLRAILAIAAVLAVVVLANACATTGATAKQSATVALQVSETASGIAQDAERALYANGSVTALTPPVHAAISRVFSRIFQDEHDAAVAMLAWRSGDPAPQSVQALLADAGEAWAALQPLLADVGAGNVATAVQGWVAKVVALADTLGLLVPQGAKAALAYRIPFAAGGVR